MPLTSINSRVTIYSDLDNIKIYSHNLQTLSLWTVQIQSEEKNQDLNVDYWVGGEPRLHTDSGRPHKAKESHESKSLWSSLPTSTGSDIRTYLPIPPYLLD